jgi:hypothetical protein
MPKQFFKPVSPQWASQLTKRLYIEESVDEKFYEKTLFAKAVAEYIRGYLAACNTAFIFKKHTQRSFH